MKDRITSWKSTTVGLILVVCGLFAGFKGNQWETGGTLITAGLFFVGYKEKAK